MKRKWTRGEKALFAAPILLGTAAFVGSVGPKVAKKALGYPTELAATPTGSLTSIALSRNGQLLASAGRLNSPVPSTSKINFIHLWSAATLKPLQPLTRPVIGFDDTNYSLSLSPDAKLLAWGDLSGGFNVSDVKSQQLLWSSKTSTSSADFSSDGRWVAFHQNGICITAARTGKVVAKWSPPNGSSEGALKFSPQGHWFASSGGRPSWKQRNKAPNGSGGEIELRRVADWKVKRIFPLPNTERVAFSPDERSLLGVSRWVVPSNSIVNDGSRLRCYNVSNGELNWEIDTHKPGINPKFRFIQDVCYSPNGATIAVLTAEDQLFLLSAKTGEIMRTLRVPASQISNCVWPGGLAWSPDGNRLFARGKDAVLVWNLK